MIVESDWKKYKKKASKDQLDENGEIKEEERKYILPLLLAQCEDFANELTALEELAQLLSDDSCTVSIHFTPKYHCEIAGCGIELDWGFSKCYYRRKIPLERKKEDFKACVEEALSTLSIDLVRRFNHKVGKYRLAYKYFEERGDQQSYQSIEKFLKQWKSHRGALDQDTKYISDVLCETYGSD